MNHRKNEIAKIFGGQPIRTRGLQKGWIIKYPRFYIKIYNDEFSSDYIIQYYKWNMDTPYKVDVVPANRLSAYANLIKE